MGSNQQDNLPQNGITRMSYQPVPGVFINPALIDGEVRIEWVPAATSSVAGTTSIFTVAGSGAPRPTLAPPPQPGQPAPVQDYFGSRRQPSDPTPVEVYEETEEEKRAKRKAAFARGGRRGGRKAGVSRKTAAGKAVAGASDASAAILISDDTVENTVVPAAPLTGKGKGKRKANQDLDGVTEADQEEAWVTDTGEGSEHEDNADGKINAQAGPSDRERRKSARDSKKDNNTVSASTPAPPPAKKTKTTSVGDSLDSNSESNTRKTGRGDKWRTGLSFEERKKLIEPALRARKIKNVEKKRKKEQEQREQSTTPGGKPPRSALAIAKELSQNAPRSSSRRKSAFGGGGVDSGKSAGDDTVMEDAENAGPEGTLGNGLVTILHLRSEHLRRFADVSQG
ncbi:hypothetical protein BDV96DRAFT_635402 [Lophiotrema nucula]|uniref:Uncharacterized protein n=1 Tax=Lophiotrema nucula TaxID=690887 RepID=A0A6A5YTC0_9PLEO|nr:hypothetical protein BDV96DRAFT_635402 [Lophiotrema nucula]